MDISKILYLIIWGLLSITFYMRTSHAERKFGHLLNFRTVVIWSNISATLCFTTAILLTLYTYN
jgi:hypothetical protein